LPSQLCSIFDGVAYANDLITSASKLNLCPYYKITKILNKHK